MKQAFAETVMPLEQIHLSNFWASNKFINLYGRNWFELWFTTAHTPVTAAVLKETKYMLIENKIYSLETESGRLAEATRE